MSNSPAVPEGQNADFLYDFLYVDTPRLSSFLAHFDDNGLSTGIKKTIAEDQTVGTDLKGSIPVASVTDKTQKINKQSIEYSYDPSLVLPIQAMNQLDEAGFIQHDIKRCHLGQLIMLRGALSVTDFRMMQDLWDTAMKLGIAENTKGMAHAKKIKEEKRLKDEWGQMKDFLVKMPHSLTAALDTGNESTFSMLEVQHLNIQAESIALAHGGAISGDWLMLGLLDGYPDNIHVNNLPSFNQSALSPIHEMMKQVSLIARAVLGRPPQSYAITPICIFRVVNASYQDKDGEFE